TGFLSDADQRQLTCALQNMRMSCDSTYLLDQETDHGTKADELMAMLEDLFEQPEAKVVVFSQWVRMHEVIARRLKARGWDHVLFHGGVPGDGRQALIDRFHDDPKCRVFLATDAGGVGLNLQHAAAVLVNMDLPWNPAVLEQRIGRVYRLGQRKNVHVVNFVAQGSIEEGMLSVLSFKKSLFAGVLDGGQSEVFMQGTRLSKFMEAVDEVTGGIGPAEVAEAVKPTEAGRTEVEGADAPPPANVSVPASQPTLSKDSGPQRAQTSVEDPWAALIDAGLGFVESLRGGNSGERTPAIRIEHDAATGRDVLKIPMPQPETMQRLVDAFNTFLNERRRDNG
ncbi:MAG TPA: C-terminal helicase domain-containing protein, partial [Burkholderiaceae bacterium]|nr:C-terminal helicase domain-containing protein [Burkholderiaceae bacterium]